MLAKSAVDPGSSALHLELLNVSRGMTQYSTQYPQSLPATTVASLYHPLKQHYDLTLIGIKNPEGEGILINPALATLVQPGARLYYIADDRINRFEWPQLLKQQD
jgi:voltage-gated potassium channel